MDTAEEIRKLEHAIAKDPGDYETLFKLGILYEQEKEYRKAGTCFQDIFLTNPSYNKAHFELGILHSINHSYDDAVREWMKVIDEDGDYQFSSMRMYNRGAVIEAIRGWEEFERSERETAYSRFTLAFAFYCLRQLDRAISNLTRTIAIDERYALVHFIMGLACEEKNDFEGAVKAYSAELSLRPDSPQVNYHMGIALQQRGMTQKAIGALQKAIKHRPRYKKALYRLGLLYSLQGSWQEAEQYLTHALNYDPVYTEAHLAMGNVYFSQYRLDEAAACYEQAISINPRLKEAFFKLGELRKVQGKPDEALAQFERVIALDPGDADVSYQTGLIYYQQKKYREAVDVLKKTIFARPLDFSAYYLLGDALTALGTPAQAVEIYKRALDYDSSNTKMRQAYGKALFQMGDFNGAAREFHKAMESEPGDLLSRHLAARASLLSGNLHFAHEMYEALAEDGTLYGHLCLGASHLWRHKQDRAIREIEKAMPLLTDSDKDPALWGTLSFFASTITEQAARDRQLGTLKRQLRDACEEVVKALLQALEVKDNHARFHSIRVALIARELASHIHGKDPEMVSAELIEDIEAASIVHDIGFIGLPGYVVHKVTALPDIDRAQMQTHPLLGVKILSNIELPWDIIPLVRSHHERWDGTGYPDKLSKDKIPLAALILGIADSYDLLITDRLGRKGKSPGDARAAMMQERDKGFPGLLLDYFASIAPGMDKTLADLTQHS